MSGPEACEEVILPATMAAEPPVRAGLWRHWREDLACVFERDPAARNGFEVFTTYPGVQAILAYRLAHRLWGLGLRYPARLLAYLTRAWTNIEIHPAARIGRRFFIDHGAGVVIGETAEVGDDCTLYHGVTLGGTSWSQGKRHPTLGRGVVVGAGAKILGPITLGDDVKVGANSVVIADVPARRTVVGIPAKVVKGRNERRTHAHGIDLDHHLIPDPVAEAVACLLERIRELETRAGITKPGRHEDEPEHRCSDCDAIGVCVRHTNKRSGG